MVSNQTLRECTFYSKISFLSAALSKLRRMCFRIARQSFRIVREDRGTQLNSISSKVGGGQGWEGGPLFPDNSTSPLQ